MSRNGTGTTVLNTYLSSEARDEKKCPPGGREARRSVSQFIVTGYSTILVLIGCTISVYSVVSQSAGLVRLVFS